MREAKRWLLLAFGGTHSSEIDQTEARNDHVFGRAKCCKVAKGSANAGPSATRAFTPITRQPVPRA